MNFCGLRFAQGPGFPWLLCKPVLTTSCHLLYFKEWVLNLLAIWWAESRWRITQGKYEQHIVKGITFWFLRWDASCKKKWLGGAFLNSNTQGFTEIHYSSPHPGSKESGFYSASPHLWTEEHFLCSQRWWARWHVWVEGASWRAGWEEWPEGSGISPHTCTGWNTCLKWCQPLLPEWENGLARWDFHGT